MRTSWLLGVLLLALQVANLHGQNLFGRLLGRRSEGGLLDDVPTVKLSNGMKFPLVGLGVGNMSPDIVPAVVSHAIRNDKKTRMIDTSAVSGNEGLVAQGIVEGADYLVSSGVEKVEVHVVTKVWHTHLGYDRTMVAVANSIEKLAPAIDHPNVDLKLHVMIHWPRCYDSIPWMNCEGDESRLPEHVRSMQPSPSSDKANAWKGSWKALEKLYLDEESPVASIGVSNFHVKELQSLSKFATVKPHIMEANIRAFLYDPKMVNHAHKHDIHLIAYQSLEGTLRHPERTPFAYHHLLTVCNELTKSMRSNGLLGQDQEIHPPQGLLTWLIQHSVSVIPRTTDLLHLIENSASFMEKIPSLTEKQAQTVAYAMEAMISGTDMEEDEAIRVTFHAKTKDLYLWWRDDEDDVEILVATIKKGEHFKEETHPGHQYKLYDSEDKEEGKFELFQVTGKYGDHHNIHY